MDTTPAVGGVTEDLAGKFKFYSIIIPPSHSQLPIHVIFYILNKAFFMKLRSVWRLSEIRMLVQGLAGLVLGGPPSQKRKQRQQLQPFPRSSSINR